MIGRGLFGLGNFVVGRPEFEYVFFFSSQRERLIHLRRFTIINLIIVWKITDIHKLLNSTFQYQKETEMLILTFFIFNVVYY